MPRIQHKRGTSANLASVNPTPLAGELVWDSTENAVKIGDGSTAWTSLAYVTATPRTHVHDGGDITTGTVAYARLPVGSTTSTVCAGDDARLTDARSPTAHKSSHATGGSDALTPSDIGAAPAASPTFTGVITVSATSGSAGSYLPSLTFSGDPNTGFGQVSGQSDTASVFTAGFERVRVDSVGRVRIYQTASDGTGVARCEFMAHGGTTVAGGFILYGASYASGIYMSLGVSSLHLYNSGGHCSLSTTTAHDVVLGSNSLARFRVKSTGAVRYVPLASDPASGEAGDVYYNSANNELRYHNGSAFVGAAPAASPAFTGTATFGQVSFLAFSLADGATLGDFPDNVVTPYIFTTNGAGSDFGGQAGHLVLQPRTNANRDIIFAGGSPTTAELVRIVGGSGRVGIGRTSPASALDVNGVITVSATSGSAGSYLPSVCFASDPNTGLGQVGGADSVSLITAGSERVRVDSSGRVGIGATPSSGNLIQYGRDISGGTGINGFIWASTIKSDVTSSANVFRTFVGTENATFTLTTLAHFRASQNTFGASSTVATQVGFLCDAVTGGTNNYGFQGLIASGTGRYNLYMSGTADNFLNGNVGIKAAPPTAALDINSDTLRLRTARTPASASASGNAGDICWDADYLYICIASGTWRRVAHSTW